MATWRHEAEARGFMREAHVVNDERSPRAHAGIMCTCVRAAVPPTIRISRGVAKPLARAISSDVVSNASNMSTRRRNFALGLYHRRWFVSCLTPPSPLSFRWRVYIPSARTATSSTANRVVLSLSEQ